MVRRAEHKRVLDELDRLRWQLANKPAAPPRGPILLPASTPPAPYLLRFPLDRDQWVTVQSNRPLRSAHWDRLAAVLAMQRENLSEDATEFAVLLTNPVGIPSDVSPTPDKAPPDA